MSFRASLPLVMKQIIRNRKGVVEVFTQGYHVLLDKVKKLKPKRKRNDKGMELANYYRSKGDKGIKLLREDTIDTILEQSPHLIDFMHEINQIYEAQKKKGNLSKKLQTITNNKFIQKALTFLEAKDRGKAKKYRNHKQVYEAFMQLANKAREFVIGRNNPLNHKIRELINQYSNKIGKIDVDEVVKFVKNIDKLQKEGILPEDIYDNPMSLAKLVKEGSLEKSSQLSIENLKPEYRELLEELTITNPFGIEDPQELLNKMLERKAYFEHTINEYIKELYHSSDNEKTREFGKLLEELEKPDRTGKPKVDNTIFYSYFNAIRAGLKDYGMSESEAMVLFFYINGNTADGKRLPVNYLHHNGTMRELTARRIDNWNSPPEKFGLTDEEMFALNTNILLKNAITKLPKVELDRPLLRGENITPITYYAKKNDLIIYETPVSTTLTREKKVPVTWTEVTPDGELKTHRKEIVQGAKVFARGNGSYMRQNSAILEGKAPEEYEGHREMLQDAKDDLGSIPQGVVLNIKSTTTYRVTKEFTTIVNRNQDEYLLPPGTILKVNGWERGEKYDNYRVQHQGTEHGGMITLDLENVSNPEEFDINEGILGFHKVIAKIVEKFEKFEKLRPKKQ